MVDFPGFENLSSNPTIGNLMSLPNASYPYYWAWIFGGIWLIITLSLYFSEKDKTGKGKMLASMAVSCFAIIMLATIGTIVGFVQLEIMIYILVLCMVIIGIWFFSD